MLLSPSKKPVTNGVKASPNVPVIVRLNASHFCPIDCVLSAASSVAPLIFA